MGTATATRTAKSISEPQKNFILALLDQREIGTDIADKIRETVDELTSPQASRVITSLKALPWKTQQVEDLADEPGLYEVNGIVFNVRWNRERTNLYAKKLVDGEYVYAGALRRNKITKSSRITVDRAIELSGLLGQCVNCLRPLTAEKSVRQGMGPVCITRV